MCRGERETERQAEHRETETDALIHRDRQMDSYTVRGREGVREIGRGERKTGIQDRHW